jgi:hypothetical protein
MKCGALVEDEALESALVADSAFEPLEFQAVCEPRAGGGPGPSQDGNCSPKASW